MSDSHAQSVPYQSDRMAQLQNGREQAPHSPRQMATEFRSSSHKMQAALSAGRYETVDSELEVVRDRASSLRGQLSNVTGAQKFKLSAIQIMYDQGIAAVQSGRESGQESKVKMGLEKIEEANRSLEELQSEE